MHETSACTGAKASTEGCDGGGLTSPDTGVAGNRRGLSNPARPLEDAAAGVRACVAAGETVGCAAGRSARRRWGSNCRKEVGAAFKALGLHDALLGDVSCDGVLCDCWCLWRCWLGRRWGDISGTFCRDDGPRGGNVSSRGENDERRSACGGGVLECARGLPPRSSTSPKARMDCAMEDVTDEVMAKLGGGVIEACTKLSRAPESPTPTPDNLPACAASNRSTAPPVKGASMHVGVYEAVRVNV